MDGVVYAQAAERAAHLSTKLATHVALLTAIHSKRLPCRVVPDGASVRIDDYSTAFEPDGFVYCGPAAAPSTLVFENPIIVVEALSPSTGRNNVSHKLAGYFKLQSVAHYLIIDPDEPLVIHHARQEGSGILTRIIREGTIALDPPGIEVEVTDLYEPRA